MTGKAQFKSVALDVDLKDIAPHFERQRIVAVRFIRNCVMCICVFILLAALLSRAPAIPLWVLIGIAVVPMIFFGREILKWSKPIELEHFRSQAGVTVFGVWREKGQEREFDAFIEALHTAIVASQEKPN
jgi:fucose 4-O-acetylase-like acetyltransferase